ncbi:hypothetical protein [Streptacidiphilus sp. MAP5-3]|uniref:hypothetical protein n=1 Tax=unclassified Streptacidiphilus TaxID=2643834 RepID=UPI0035188397
MPSIPSIRTAVEREFGALARAIRDGVRRNGFPAIPMTLAATLAIVLFQLWQRTSSGAGIVERLGVVRASLPLRVELARTPLSLFVPAPDLPVWGAAAQVFFVFGIAELTFGRLRTLGIAYASTLAATMYARQGIEMGHGRFFGLSYAAEFGRDTGPSVAVVALAICIAWRYRTVVTGCLVGGAMLVEALLVPNLAGQEHLVAILTALTFSVGAELLRRQALRTGAALDALEGLDGLEHVPH